MHYRKDIQGNSLDTTYIVAYTGFNKRVKITDWKIMTVYEWNTEFTEEELAQEVLFADLMRSLDAIIYSWENDDLEIEDMTLQLEMACDVMEGKVEYQQMINKLGIRGIQYS